MPERRTINRSITTNYRVAKLSEPAQKLFTWMILWADVDGRLPGEAGLIKSSISPHSSFTVEEVDGWLNEMAKLKDVETDLGLIERYEVKGQKYIYMPGFEHHQSGRVKDKEGNIREAKSHIPPPPETKDIAEAPIPYAPQKEVVRGTYRKNPRQLRPRDSYTESDNEGV